MESRPRAPRLPVPIIPSQRRRAWPAHADARPVTYHTLTTALTTRYPYDAHTAAYSMPTRPYRLSSGTLHSDAHDQGPHGVAMVLAAFDIDCPASHRASGGSGDVASQAWWEAELHEVEALAHVHPRPFAYRSRGGYRLLWLLPEPHILRTPTDREVWSARYLGWCAYLARCFDIHADPSCQDWTRLYRLPHATRTEGGQPEEWETAGDPKQIGIWACTPTAEDMAMARMLCKRKSGAVHERRRTAWTVTSHGDGLGILYHAFGAWGWLGHEIEAGRWAVKCPWEAEHTKGERYDTSTVLFAPGDGESLGWWHCSHAHCTGRDLRDVLAVFSPAEIYRAREQAGLPPQRGRLRATGSTGGLRTVQAPHVPMWRTIPAQEVKQWQ